MSLYREVLSRSTKHLPAVAADAWSDKLYEVSPQFAFCPRALSRLPIVSQTPGEPQLKGFQCVQASAVVRLCGRYALYTLLLSG